MSDREIKIRVGVDTISIQAARRALGELITDAERLAKVLGSAGSIGVNIPGAGGGGGQAGAGPSHHQAPRPSSSGGGGVGGFFSGVVTGVSNAVKGAASGATQAVKSITDSVRDASTQTDPYIRKMTAALMVLARAFKETSDASKQMGGMPGMPGAGGGGVPFTPLRGAVPTASHDPSAFAAAILDGARAHRMSAASNPAMASVFSSGLTHAIGDSESRIKMLEGHIQRLTTAHSRTRAKIEAGGGTEADETRLLTQERLTARRAKELSGERERLSALQTEQDGGPGWMGRASQWASQRLGVPGWMGRAGVAGVAAYGLYKGYDVLAGGMQANQLANNAEMLRQPGYQSSFQAQIGRGLGGLAGAVQGGSFGTQIALKQALSDPTVIQEMSKKALRAQLGELAVKHNQPFINVPGMTDGLEAALPGMPPPASSMIRKAKQTGWTMLTDFFTGDDRERTYAYPGMTAAPGSDGAPKGRRADADKLAFEQEARQLVPNSMQKFLQRVQEKREKDPQYYSTLDSIIQNASGRASLARAAGISGASIEDADGNIIGDSTSRFEQRAYAMGLDPSQLAGFNQQMGAQGRGFIGRGGSIAGMTLGGLGNAASLYGVGAQNLEYGGKGTPGFLQAVQGSIGRGGLDVTAGSTIAEAVSQQMLASGGVLGGGAAMEGFAMAAYTGTTGGDMRNSRLVGAGMQGMASTFQGKGSPLDSALTTRAAYDAAGGNAHAADLLMGLSPAELMEYTRSDKPLPRELTAAGVTKDMLKGFVGTRQKEQMAGAMTRGMRGELKETFDMFQSAGGNIATMRKNIGKDKKLSGKKLDQEMDEQMRILARNFHKDLGHGSYEEALGDLMNQGQLYGKDKLKGDGAGDPLSRKSLDFLGVKSNVGSNQNEEERRAKAAKEAGGDLAPGERKNSEKAIEAYRVQLQGLDAEKLGKGGLGEGTAMARTGLLDLTKAIYKDLIPAIQEAAMRARQR